MSYENMLFARELSLDKQRLEKQADKNKRIRNFNQTLSAMFDILGVTVNPLFALGGSVTEWLNPEKKLYCLPKTTPLRIIWNIIDSIIPPAGTFL